MQPIIPLSSSYRDNAGFVFEQNNKIYRCVNALYFSHYDVLMHSGLYAELVNAGRLIAHEEMDAVHFGVDEKQQKIILPTQIPFISYPYEWSFDMYKDAAIVTLKTMQVALKYSMVLKDATPFNIQFFNGRPVFIDTLSFEKYIEGKTWIAYRQFCESFLSPLLLMHYNHRDLGKLMLLYPNGIPLEITKSLLPLKSRLNIHVHLHIFLQARLSTKIKNSKEIDSFFSKEKMLVLINGLLEFVSSLKPVKLKSTWDDYYTDTILGNNYLESKKKLVAKFCEGIHFKTAVDLGANDGYFSIMLQKKAENIIAIDFDSNCVNGLYKTIRKNHIKNIIPIVSTLNVPTPAIGWANEERFNLTQRVKGDVTFALALVHHLAISANIPLQKIAGWLQGIGEYLIIEFVPKTDEKVKELLLHREDIFEQYYLDDFKKCFEEYYNILKEEKVGNTDRILFLMQKKQR